MPLSDKQKDYLINSTHSFNICSGVSSSGKTFINNLRWYEFIRNEVPKGELLMMSGKTKETLHDNVVRDLEKIDDCNCIKIHKQPLRIFITDKDIEIACVSADDESSWGRIQGKTVFGWYADEIVEHPESLVNIAIKSCRSGGKQRMKFWTCNPDHPDHFVKKNFIDSSEVDVKNWFFGFPDNPILDKGYIKELEQTLTGVFKERLFFGKWNAAEGNIFTNFDPSFHVVDKLPEMLDYFVGVDWGYNNPTAMTLIGIDRDGIYYAIDEWYQSGRLVDASLAGELNAKGWNKNGTRGQMPSYVYADSEDPASCEALRRVTGWSVVPAAKPAGSVVDGIRIIQQLLQKGGNDKARLYFHPRCVNLIGQMGGYRWKKVRGRELDEPVKENDHSVDSLRYTIFSREAGRVRLVKRNPFK